MNDILERMRAGEVILESDPDYPQLYQLFENSMELVGRLNTGYHSADEVRSLLSQLWGQPLDPSVRMFPPFYTAFGKFTKVGKGVFVNFGCTFLDRGGITLDDDVFIGPGVQILTENHPENPRLRRNVYTRPVHVKRGAWIGANAIVLPGVTIGENAIVGAGSVVPKDVPDRAIVVGNPARFVRYIRDDE
ncbi:MAG: sugar O-acetyltransferase [Bacteroidales bacterium]|nr:sugar O-acetyltransferase [Bacteroidales bacterium]